MLNANILGQRKVQHPERHLAELSEGPDSKNGKKTVFGKSREYLLVHPEVELLQK